MTNTMGSSIQEIFNWLHLISCILVYLVSYFIPCSKHSIRLNSNDIHVSQGVKNQLIYLCNMTKKLVNKKNKKRHTILHRTCLKITVKDYSKRLPVPGRMLEICESIKWCVCVCVPVFELARCSRAGWSMQ